MLARLFSHDKLIIYRDITYISKVKEDEKLMIIVFGQYKSHDPVNYTKRNELFNKDYDWKIKKNVRYFLCSDHNLHRIILQGGEMPQDIRYYTLMQQKFSDVHICDDTKVFSCDIGNCLFYSNTQQNIHNKYVPEQGVELKDISLLNADPNVIIIKIKYYNNEEKITTVYEIKDIIENQLSVKYIQGFHKWCSNKRKWVPLTNNLLFLLYKTP